MSLATQDMMSTFKSPKWIQSSQWACRPTETYTDSWFLVRTLDPPPLSKKKSTHTKYDGICLPFVFWEKI